MDMLGLNLPQVASRVRGHLLRHEHTRHVTITVFAALNVLTGKVPVRHTKRQALDRVLL